MQRTIIAAKIVAALIVLFQRIEVLWFAIVGGFD